MWWAFCYTGFGCNVYSQMLTWSLSLRRWFLQWYVSKALSILFHTVVPVLFPMVYNALLTETYALSSLLSSDHENSWSLTPSQFFYFWLFTFKKHLKQWQPPVDPVEAIAPLEVWLTYRVPFCYNIYLRLGCVNQVKLPLAHPTRGKKTCAKKPTKL